MPHSLNDAWVQIDNPLPISRNSFLSTQAGDGNLLKISFFKRKKELRAEVFFGAKSEGPPGFVHGGAMAAVLDEVMGCAAWVGAFPVVTGRMTVDFLDMVPVNSTVRVDTQITGIETRKVNIEAILGPLNSDAVSAKSTGLFIKLNEEKLARLLENREAARNLGVK